MSYDLISTQMRNLHNKRVRFNEKGETHHGIVIGSCCGNSIYIQPEDWPEEDFPHIVPYRNVVVMDNFINYRRG